MNIFLWSLLLFVELLFLFLLIGVYQRLSSFYGQFKQLNSVWLKKIQLAQGSLNWLGRLLRMLETVSFFSFQPKSWKGRLIWWGVRSVVQGNKIKPISLKSAVKSPTLEG